jgi:hypothetical protein
MTLVLILVAFVILASLAALALRPQHPPRAQRRALRRRRPLAAREQAMYLRLQEALPGQVVLAQVAFSALVTAPSRSARNVFDAKVADFVVCTSSFEVLAVIEFDDPSHKGGEPRDASRKVLKDVGYRVLRYTQLPDAGVVAHDVAALAAASDEGKPAAATSGGGSVRAHASGVSATRSDQPVGLRAP